MEKEFNNKECPECKSIAVQTEKRGFKLARATIASLLVTPLIGVPLGMMGRNKLVNHCLDCDHKWPYVFKNKK